MRTFGRLDFETFKSFYLGEARPMRSSSCFSANRDRFCLYVIYLTDDTLKACQRSTITGSEHC